MVFYFLYGIDFGFMIGLLLAIISRYDDAYFGLVFQKI